jgi:hypothetical protein
MSREKSVSIVGNANKDVIVLDENGIAMTALNDKTLLLTVENGTDPNTIRLRAEYGDTGLGATLVDNLAADGSSVGVSGAVTGILAGSGISVDTPTGIVTITATGGGGGGGAVDSIIAGSGISVDQSTGDVTITATGGGGGGGAPNVTTISSGTTMAVNVDNTDIAQMRNTAASDLGITISNPTGTLINGGVLKYILQAATDNQTLTWGTAFSTTTGVTLPTVIEGNDIAVEHAFQYTTFNSLNKWVYLGSWSDEPVVSSGGITFAAGPDAATSMAVNTHYLAPVGGFAAARIYTLPAVAAVGDVCIVTLTSGHATRDISLTAASGDTLNGVAGGSVWSNLFIADETVTMTCTVANTTWIVTNDHRIPQEWRMEISTLGDGEGVNTFVAPTALSTPAAWTATVDNASMTTVASSLVTMRRANSYQMNATYTNKDSGTDGAPIIVQLQLNGTTEIFIAGGILGGTAGNIYARAGGATLRAFAAGDTVTYRLRTQDGGLGINANPVNSFSGYEVLGR